MAGALVGLFLVLAWALCWYGFFVRLRRPTSIPVRGSVPFMLSGFLLLFTLGMWGSQVWSRLPLAASPVVLLAGGALVLCGQGLMLAARAALPLSNYDLLVRLAIAPRAARIYRYVWHPMYVGLLVALVGTSLLVGGLALMFMWFVGAALVVRIAAERWG